MHNTEKGMEIIDKKDVDTIQTILEVKFKSLPDFSNEEDNDCFILIKTDSFKMVKDTYHEAEHDGETPQWISDLVDQLKKQSCWWEPQFYTSGTMDRTGNILLCDAEAMTKFFE